MTRPVMRPNDATAILTWSGTVIDVRCSMCGSERLSPLGELRSTQSNATLRLVFKRPGLLKSPPTFIAGFARACLDCGALLPFLGETDRWRLDVRADGLSDVGGVTESPSDSA
jgi:hypothetical protein